MSRLIDQGPYRTPEEPPKPAVKHEWYFKQSDEAFNTTAVVLLAVPGMMMVAAVCSFIFEPRSLLSWTWVRALAVLVAYCVIWFALVLRRKPIK